MRQGISMWPAGWASGHGLSITGIQDTFATKQCLNPALGNNLKVLTLILAQNQAGFWQDGLDLMSE